MVDLPNIKNYPKETKRIYLIICIFAAFLNKRLANKMKKGLFLRHIGFYPMGYCKPVYQTRIEL